MPPHTVLTPASLPLFSQRVPLLLIRLSSSPLIYPTLLSTLSHPNEKWKLIAAQSTCAVCGLPAFANQKVTLLYLCRHIVHAHCALVNPDTDLPERNESESISALLSSDKSRVRRRALGNRLAYASSVRVRVGKCPSCVHAG